MLQTRMKMWASLLHVSVAAIFEGAWYIQNLLVLMYLVLYGSLHDSEDKKNEDKR